MKNKFFWFILIIFFLILHVSCRQRGLAEKNEARAVRAIPAVVRAIPNEVTGFGSLSFLSKVDIVSTQEAQLKKLYYREGDFVKEGEIIIKLENPQINLAVKRAENNYSQARAAYNLANSRLLEGIFQSEAQLLALEKSEKELDLMKKKWHENDRKHQNQETLFDAGGIHTEAILTSRFTLETEWEQIQLMEKELEIRRIGSRDIDLIKAGFPVPEKEDEKREMLITLMTSGLRAELEAAKARFDAAEKELESARLALSELTVYSSASGIIGARYFEEGERVKPNDKILTLMDTASLYAIFPIREKDALRIEKGMPASVLIDGSGETRSGSVDLVYPQADSQSLSFLVRVLLEKENNIDKTLKPGMFARISVTLGEPKESVYIPETSVFNRNNNTNEGNVFIVQGKNLAERKIKLGASYGEEREVEAGVYAGEIVVVKPSSDLREGTYVSLIK